MPNRISFSNRDLALSEISEHYDVTTAVLTGYYSDSDQEGYHIRFVGYSSAKVESELTKHLRELDITSSFTILTSLEASFRIDYLLRCYQKLKDPLSRHFRATYKSKERAASLEDDILQIWKSHCTTKIQEQVIAEYIATLKYRHWIAHGRYWQPANWGRKQYNYNVIYTLALNIYYNLPLQRTT